MYFTIQDTRPPHSGNSSPAVKLHRLVATKAEKSVHSVDLDIYCHVPEGLGLQQTASPLSRDETRTVNPLVRKQVD